MATNDSCDANSGTTASGLQEINKRDLILWFLYVVSTTRKELSYTRLCKSLFLLQNYLCEELHQKPAYSFETFMIHTGVFDNQLIKDLQIWEFLGLLKNLSFPYDETIPTRAINSHNINLTASGKDYVKRIAEPTIAKKLGKDALKELRIAAVRFVTEDETALINEANKRWITGENVDPRRSEWIHEFLALPE